MKPYTLDFRLKMIQVYEKEKLSYRQLAQRFDVALSFIIKLLKQYRETGDVSPRTPPGRTPKVTAEHEQFVFDLVKKDPCVTLVEIQTALEMHFDLRLSTSTISRILQRLKLTRKKKSRYPTRKASEEVQTQRLEFREQVSELDPEQLIFIDESGVNLGMNLPYGRCESGQRLYAPQNPRGQNVSICAGIGLRGVVGSAVILGAYDGLSFEAFIATQIVPHLQPGDYVLMDNCSIHKGAEIEKLIEAAGGHLLYLPPYSPDFSPIENCWSKFKHVLRKVGAKTYKDLSKAISAAWDTISLNNIKSWFAHCCYCTS